MGYGLRRFSRRPPSARRHLRRLRKGPSSPSMCKHILNAQVAIRAPCCKQWFDCAECHAETQDHRLKRTVEMSFLCKKCKKAFRKDMTNYEESDEYCPHCDNHYVIEAKTPQAALGVEGEDPRINARMLKDERVKQDAYRSLLTQDNTDRIG
ncbi:CHY zinc finger-domain-containing protein [Trametes meyenii]|nr:CHY zinc finger-domain-containing protein [Trametes meyenii]